MKSRLSYGILFVSVFVAIHILLFLSFGNREYYDSLLYQQGADHLLVKGLLKSNDQYFYFLPIAVMAVFQKIFGDSKVPFVIFQSLISAVSIYYLYKASVRYYHGSAVAGIVTIVIMIFWIDVIRWNVVFMTESLFCSLVCLTLYRMTTFNGRSVDVVVLLVAGMAVVMSRPTGIIILMSVLVFFTVYYRETITQSRLLLLCLSFLLLTLTVWGALMMFSMWDFTDQYVKGNVVTYADVVEGTTLDHHLLRVRNDVLWIPDAALHPVEKMFTFIVHNPIHFLKAGFLKLVYLLFAVRPYYSLQHNVFSIVWMIFLYSALWISIKRNPISPTTYAMFCMIGFNCILVSISTVDWDNRFYVPMAPAIAMFAGGGIAKWLARFRATKA